MKVAAMTLTASVNGLVAPSFREAEYVLILDADTGKLLEAIPKEDDLVAAKKIVDADCEAVLCGPIEKDVFSIVADQGCVTRYAACGLPAEEAVVQMNRYALEMITDYIGGHGCGSGQAGACESHPEHHHGD